MTTLHAGMFELTGISGVCLAAGPDVLGIRLVGVHAALGTFDGKDLPLSISAPPLQAPDLSYARSQWRVPVSASGVRRFIGRPIRATNSPCIMGYQAGEAATVTLEWRLVGATVTGRYTADAPVTQYLVINGSFAAAKVVECGAADCRLRLGTSDLRVCLRGELGAPLCLTALSELELAHAGLPYQTGDALVVYPVTLVPGQALEFALHLGVAESAEPVTLTLPDSARLAADLAAAAATYDKVRMRGTGAVAGAPEAIASLTAYSRAYDPETASIQTTVNRTWGGAGSKGLIFGWDNFFTSYIAAWEDPATAAASLEQIVQRYGRNGIANGPTQRNLIIPILYCRTIQVLGDWELARRTWPTLMAFMRFWFADRGDGIPWRDGNRDGLIESGCSHPPAAGQVGRVIQEAMDETGYDELPIYSAGFTDGRRGLLEPGVEFDWKSRCLTVSLVCQNSLYIAACRAMAALGRRLGHDADVTWLAAEAARVAARIQERLYCDRDGVFRDRHWGGEFSTHSVMTVFFPLLAGVCDDTVKTRLHGMLTDPQQFWGNNLCPTVARNDAAYNDGLDQRGNYWRGNGWAPTTYMVCLAAKEAGWDKTVAEYGTRTHRQFMEYWRKHVHAYENYPPEGKVDHDFLYINNWGGREVRYVWAGMMLLCGLEELFGFELDGRLRFGNPFLPRQGRWERFRFQGACASAEAGPKRTRVGVAGRWTFTATPGAAIRRFELTTAGVNFAATAEQPVTVLLNEAAIRPQTTATGNGLPLAAKASVGELRVALPAGTTEVVICF